MMQEILKPLFDNDVLSADVKDQIETALVEAINSREQAVRKAVEDTARVKFDEVKNKFEKSFKTLEESYKAKLTEAKINLDLAKDEISELEERVETLETRPFVNINERDLEEAERTLLSEAEENFKSTYNKFNDTFDIIHESTSHVIGSLKDALVESQSEINSLNGMIESLETDLRYYKNQSLGLNEQISKAVARNEVKMRAEADKRIDALKENLVAATEIFLEQEMYEIKADRVEIMKEMQGRDLLESIKTTVKRYWDVDSEVATEILEMKKEAEAKVTQYKDMLKREHARLEESRSEVESLKKRVIVESKGSVLDKEKKRTLEKLAQGMNSDRLESEIDTLMESVIDTFNSGFSKKAVAALNEKTSKPQTRLNESIGKKTAFSSGDSNKKTSTSDELAQLLEFAGVKR